MLETGSEAKFLLETQQTGEKERDPKKSPRYSGDRRSDGGTSAKERRHIEDQLTKSHGGYMVVLPCFLFLFFFFKNSLYAFSHRRSITDSQTPS